MFVPNAISRQAASAFRADAGTQTYAERRGLPGTKRYEGTTEGLYKAGPLRRYTELGDVSDRSIRAAAAA